MITKHRYTQNIKALGRMVSEKTIVYVLPIVSIWALISPGRNKFGLQGHVWQDLCRVPLNIGTYQIYRLLGLMVSKTKIFSCYSYYKPLTNNEAPKAWAI